MRFICIIIISMISSVAVAQQKKEVISEYQGGLSIVKKINPVKYKMKPEKVKKVSYEFDSLGNEKQKVKEETILNDKVYIGISAEELQTVAPDLVTSYTNEEGEEALAIEFTAFTYLLINAVKEQQALIEELQSALKIKK